MDSSGGSLSPDHSWLAFSLSNHYYHTSDPPQVQPHHLCLFQHTHPPSPGEVGVDNGATSHQQHNNHNELSFLGGGGGGLLQVGLFPTVEAGVVTVADTGGGGGGAMYEQEQKTIATSFLGGFSVVQQQQEQQQQQLVQQQGEEERIMRGDANKQLAVVAASAAVSSTNNNKKSVEGFGHRTSIYRGVTRHRWTGRYEAHLWDNSCRREGQSRKGRQVYLGGYDKEEKAARAYDLAALKYWGPTTTTNFPISDYEKELEEMQNMSRQEFVASLRRKSSGFSRGASIYRGVTRHHQHGRWQARIGRVAGNKDLYLGTFSTQEEAAEAYDIAAIKFRGLNAVTNFDISRYDVKSIISSNLPVGGMSNKSRSSLSDHSASEDIKVDNGVKSDNQEFISALPLLTSPHQPTSTSTLNFAIPTKPNSLSQNYDLPNLGQTDHNEPIGYGFGYVNHPINGGGRGGADDNSVSEEYNASASSSDNSWIVTPSLHSFQSPKSNLSVPIFGIE